MLLLNAAFAMTDIDKSLLKCLELKIVFFSNLRAVIPLVAHCKAELHTKHSYTLTANMLVNEKHIVLFGTLSEVMLRFTDQTNQQVYI